MSGAINEIIYMANGPPIIIPTVPVKNMINALGPNFKMLGKSILIVSRTRLVGSRYLDATK